MTKIIFGIPSYHREKEQLTLDMLNNFGISSEQIIIAVQCKEDLQAYKKYQGRAQIIYQEGKNKSDNANTILNILKPGDRLVLMDDDVKAISFLNHDKKLKPIPNREEFFSMLNVGFSIAQKYHTSGFGLYPVNNAFFMSHSYTPKNICIGTLLGLVVTYQRFDCDFPVKEDYEYTASAIKRYGAFIRLNNFSCNAKHYTAGGCTDFWQDGYSNNDCAERLCRRYPTIIKQNKARHGEVKMAHTTKKIPYHWKYEGSVCDG